MATALVSARRMSLLGSPGDPPVVLGELARQNGEGHCKFKKPPVISRVAALPSSESPDRTGQWRQWPVLPCKNEMRPTSGASVVSELIRPADADKLY